MREAEEDEPLLGTEDPPFESGRFSPRFRKETNPISTKMASGTLVPSSASPTKVIRWADGVQKDTTGPTGQAVDPATTSAANPTPSLHQAIAAYNAGGASTLSLAGQVAACKAISRASSAPGPNLKDAVENYMTTARQRKAADAVYPAASPDATQIPMLGKELAPPRRSSPRFERFSTAAADGKHSPTGARSPRSGSPLAGSRSPIMKSPPMVRDALDHRDHRGNPPRGMPSCTAPPPPAGRFQRSGARASGASGARAAPLTAPFPAVETAAPRRAPPPKVEQPPVGDLLGDLIDLSDDASRPTPGAGAPQSAPLSEQPLTRSASSSSLLASDLNGVRL